MEIADRESILSIAVCVNNEGYPASLELLKLYQVLPDEHADPSHIRVVDESGEDYLYPAHYFLPVTLSKESSQGITRLLHYTIGQQHSQEEMRSFNDQHPTERDFPREAHDLVEDYGDLLKEEDLDQIASSRAVRNAADLLVEISGAMKAVSSEMKSLSGHIKAGSSKKGFSPRKLQEMLRSFKALRSTYDYLKSAYDELEPFTEWAINTHKAKFGDRSGEDDYSAVEEAERILNQLSP